MHSAANWPSTAIQRRRMMVCSRSRLLTGSASTRWFFFFFGRRNVCSNASILVHSGGDDLNTVNATLGRRHASCAKPAYGLMPPGQKENGCMRAKLILSVVGGLLLGGVAAVAVFPRSAREAVPATGRATIERQGADRRPVHAHRPDRQAGHRQGLPRPLHARVLRLHRLPRHLSRRPAADLRRARQDRRQGG